MAKSTVSLKLLIDNQSKRVLFAEASKDFVDLLFYIPSLPVAKLISLVGNEGVMGSVGNLCSSIENLNESYIQPNKTKDELLNPPIMSGSSSVPLLDLNSSNAVRKFYTCGNHRHNVLSDDTSAVCENCDTTMNCVMNYVAPPTHEQVTASDEGGFVKGVVTYMVMDDLTVKPMSAISSIALLSKFNVNEVGMLEEKMVDLGMTEAIKLLKASLQTDKVLTHVFLK